MRDLKYRMIRDSKIVGYMRFRQSTNDTITIPQSYVDLEYALISEDYPEDNLFWENYGGHISRRPQCDSLDEFTGLKDKNGKGIYEEDIFGSAPQLRCIVKREDDGAYKLHFLDTRIKSISIVDHKISKSEIIGNKWDNPKLLER